MSCPDVNFKPGLISFYVTWYMLATDSSIYAEHTAIVTSPVNTVFLLYCKGPMTSLPRLQVGVCEQMCAISRY